MTDQTAEPMAEGQAPQDTAAARDPAGQAAAHLRAATQGLRAAYDHPHHGPRLEQIEAHLANLEHLISELPAAEEQRAEYADRLLGAYRSRQLPAALPDHAELLLSQELERTGQ